MQTGSFKDLLVWQKSVELAKEMYSLTKDLPSQEMFGLTSQMRRAAVSIPSNIAEGSKRGSKKDFSQFLRIASGSAAELETQFLILKDHYPKIATEHASNLLSEIQKMLTMLVRSLS